MARRYTFHLSWMNVQLKVRWRSSCFIIPIPSSPCWMLMLWLVRLSLILIHLPTVTGRTMPRPGPGQITGNNFHSSQISELNFLTLGYWPHSPFIQIFHSLPPFQFNAFTISKFEQLRKTYKVLANWQARVKVQSQIEKEKKEFGLWSVSKTTPPPPHS